MLSQQARLGLNAEPRPYSAYAPMRRARRASSDADREQEISRIAGQLAAIGQSIVWGRVQTDDWDARSRFIYRLKSAARVRAEASRVAAVDRIDADPFGRYALRRWYCFWSARMAELLFLRHPGVRHGPPRHRQIDFLIDGVPFDLKTSEVPRIFAHSPDDLVHNPGRLAAWLYEHQSREGRFHTTNRLFLVLCDPAAPGEAWRLRADVAALRSAIDRFMERRRFVELELSDGPGRSWTVLTAVVPVLRPDGPRQLGLALTAAPLGRAPAKPNVAPSVAIGRLL
jgi:hypothetical protein